MEILRKGSRGTSVLELQKSLSIVCDGIFGPMTEAQVKLFQEKNGLVSDGIVGPKTWNALGSKPPNFIMGVDTSHYESGFDFVKGVKDGVVFMMTKASEGSGNLDSTCSTLVKKAKDAGVKYCGIYHFHHAGQSVSDQISNYFRQYNSVKTEMAPILDIEETSMDGISAAIVKASALYWLEQAESKSGKTPIIYIDMNMLNILGLNGDAKFNRFTRWIARYSDNEPTVAWTFWQYTDKGEQGADTDWFHGTEDDLKKFVS